MIKKVQTSASIDKFIISEKWIYVYILWNVQRRVLTLLHYTGRHMFVFNHTVARHITACAISAFHYTRVIGRVQWKKTTTGAIPNPGENDSQHDRFVAISKVLICPLKLDGPFNEIVSCTCETVRQVAGSIESFSLKTEMLFVRDARRRKILLRARKTIVFSPTDRVSENTRFSMKALFLLNISLIFDLSFIFGCISSFFDHREWSQLVRTRFCYFDDVFIWSIISI